MKKAAVITASIILFVILIGLNYLLWDNSSKKQDIQSLENNEVTNQQSFQNLYYENEALKRDYNELEDDVEILNEIILGKDEEIDSLKADKLNDDVLVGDKNTIIYQLKSHVDTDYFKAILNEWITNINDEAYFAAYMSHNEKNIFDGRSDIYLGRYDDMYKNIDFMEVTEFKVRVIDSEDSLDQDAKNRIAFDALLNVELKKDEEGFPIDDAIFRNGINHFKVTMSFDMVSWRWYIWTIE